MIRNKILLIIIAIPSACAACPCCVGTVTADSEPFFSDDCYKEKQAEKAQQTPQLTEKGVHHE